MKLAGNLKLGFSDVRSFAMLALQCICGSAVLRFCRDSRVKTNLRSAIWNRQPGVPQFSECVDRNVRPGHFESLRHPQ